VKTEAISVLHDLLADANDVCASVPASPSPVAVRSKSESLAPLVAANRHVQGDSEESLLVQVGKGDKEALSILFQRHARAVYNVARRILKDDSEAEDLVQDLFLFIFQKAQSFDATKGTFPSPDRG
jgi:RNA polymerase sigma-70 factor (ECF subfamily)